MGLLAGVGALTLSGLGPMVAAGWLAATVTGTAAGAAVGGIVGALTAAGLSDEDAEIYAHGLGQGGTIVAARVDEELTLYERGRDAHLGSPLSLGRKARLTAPWPNRPPSEPQSDLICAMASAGSSKPSRASATRSYRATRERRLCDLMHSQRKRIPHHARIHTCLRRGGAEALL